MNRRLIGAYVNGLIARVADDPNGPLAEAQAKLAKRILMKARLKQPREVKLFFCRRCKSYAPPLYGKTVRLNGGHLVYTCRLCGKVYRGYYK